MMLQTGKGYARTAALVLLCLAGSGLLVKGFAQFVLVDGAGYDLKLSWTNEQYFLRRVNPFDVTTHISGPGWMGPRRAVVFPDLGIAEFTTYPPWAYADGIIFQSPRWPNVKEYFLAWNLSACAFLLWWLARTASVGSGDRYRWLVAGALFSNVAISQTLVNGNLGILVIAFTAGSFLLDELGFELAAGFVMGIAMLKPTIAGPFLLIFLIRCRWRAFFSATAWVVATWVGASWYVRTAPMEFLGQMFRSPEHFSLGGYALWQGLAHFGMPKTMALAANALVVLAPATWLMFRSRNEILPALAVAAVCARLFTYHTTIDNVSLLFLPLALWMREGLPARIAFWVVTATLMLPLHPIDSLPAHLALYAIWVAVLPLAWRDGLRRPQAGELALSQSPVAAVSGLD